MKYAIIKNGKVDNVIEADQAFADSVGAIAAGTGAIGDLWNGTVFSKPPQDLDAKKLAANALIIEQLAATDLTIIRALTENDEPRIAAHKIAQAALRATLQP